MGNQEQKPMVGVGVIVFKDGKILLGKRKHKDGLGDGEYSWQGGHLEYMESFEGCAKREVMEETGMQIENIKFLRLCNLKDYSPKHYVDICLTADWKSGEPQVREPNKIESWSWYDLDNLPTPLFKAEYSSIEALKTGKNFFDN